MPLETKMAALPSLGSSLLAPRLSRQLYQFQKQSNWGHRLPQQLQAHRFPVKRREDSCFVRSDSSLQASVSSTGAVNAGVLQLPLRQELTPEDTRNVFGYSRGLKLMYEIGIVIGAGSFGVVREVTELTTGRKFACKTIPKLPKKGSSTPRYLLKIQTEVDCMQQIGASLDAVFLQDVFEDDEAVHLVMELCKGGTILERVKTQEHTERRIATILRSVLRFVAQCHAKGIIYRDVKPDNFMFLTKDIDSPVRATDFGLSIRHRPQDGLLSSRSGTPVYMAPEVILHEYNEKCDEWSVGVLAFQMLTGRFPFWDSIHNISLQQVWQGVLVKKVDLDSRRVRSEMSDGARDLLRGLLERDPEKRMTAAQALEMPWVREAGKASDLPMGGSVVQRLQRYATYGHLKQLVLKMITDAMHDHQGTSESLQQVRTLFEDLDADSSGGISGDELAAGLRSHGYSVTADEAEQLMKRMDLNDDGALVFDEFASGLLDWRGLQKDGSWATWVNLAFERMDGNSDGFISLEELVELLPQDTVDDERLLEARRMLREADTDGDERISKEEFENLLSSPSLPDSLDHYDSRLSRQAGDDGDSDRDSKPASTAPWPFSMLSN